MAEGDDHELRSLKALPPVRKFQTQPTGNLTGTMAAFRPDGRWEAQESGLLDGRLSLDSQNNVKPGPLLLTHRDRFASCGRGGDDNASLLPPTRPARRRARTSTRPELLRWRNASPCLASSTNATGSYRTWRCTPVNPLGGRMIVRSRARRPLPGRPKGLPALSSRSTSNDQTGSGSAHFLVVVQGVAVTESLSSMPFYDVWPKSCEMTYPAGPAMPAAPVTSSNVSSARKWAGPQVAVPAIRQPRLRTRPCPRWRRRPSAAESNAT